jgi:hypothetical protein
MQSAQEIRDAMARSDMELAGIAQTALKGCDHAPSFRLPAVHGGGALLGGPSLSTAEKNELAFPV